MLKLRILIVAFLISVIPMQPAKANVKTAAILAGWAWSIGLIYAIYNRIEINKVRDKYEEDDPLRGDHPDKMSCLCNWACRRWSDHVPEDNKALEDIKLDLQNGHLKIKDEDGYEIEEPTLDEAIEAIDREITEFYDDTDKLKEKHLSYFKIPQYDKKGYGFDYAIECFCTDNHIDYNAPLSWTKDQRLSIKAAVCKNALWHYIFKPNYGHAAKVYWNLLIKYWRLKPIQKMIERIKEQRRKQAQLPPPHIIKEIRNRDI